MTNKHYLLGLCFGAFLGTILAAIIVICGYAVLHLVGVFK